MIRELGQALRVRHMLAFNSFFCLRLVLEKLSSVNCEGRGGLNFLVSEQSENVVFFAELWEKTRLQRGGGGFVDLFGKTRNLEVSLTDENGLVEACLG